MVGEEEKVADWFDDESVHKAFATLFTYYNNHEEYSRSKAENIWFGPAKIEKNAQGQASLTGHIPAPTDEHEQAEQIMILNKSPENKDIIKYYNHYSWLSGLKMPIGNDGNFFKNEWEHVLPIFHQMIFAGGLAGYSYLDAPDFRTDDLDDLINNNNVQDAISLVIADFTTLNTMRVDTLASNPMTSSQIYHRIKNILKIDKTQKYKNLSKNREHLNLLCIAKSEKFLNQCKSDSVFVCLKRFEKKYQYAVDTKRIEDFFNGISLNIVANPNMNFKDELWQSGKCMFNNKPCKLVRAAGKPSNHSYNYITKGAKENQIPLGLCLRDDFIDIYTENSNRSQESEQIRDEGYASWKQMAIHNVTQILTRIVYELNNFMIERTLFNCIYLLCYSHPEWNENENKGERNNKYIIPTPANLQQRNSEWSDKELNKMTRSSYQYVDPEDPRTIPIGEVVAEDESERPRRRRRCRTTPDTPHTPERNPDRLVPTHAQSIRGAITQNSLAQAELTDNYAERGKDILWSSLTITEENDKKSMRSCYPIEYFVGKCIRKIYNLDIDDRFNKNMDWDTDLLGSTIGENTFNLTLSQNENTQFKDKKWQKTVLKKVLLNCIIMSYKCEPADISASANLDANVVDMDANVVDMDANVVDMDAKLGFVGGSSKKVLKTKRGKKKLGYKKRK